MLELRQEAQNIERELALVRDKQQQLTIVAPQRGQVVTWKVRDLLLQRPVVRGQGLLTLANPDGPWELELYLPERRLKHVQAAAAKPSDNRSAARRRRSSCRAIRARRFTAASSRSNRRPKSAATKGTRCSSASPSRKQQLPPLHDQTTVTAKLNCGRTSIGYAWFCDLIETVQTKVLFWLPS